MNCLRLSSILLLLLLPDSGQAQAKDFVQIISVVEQDVAPGQKADITVSFVIEKGYHIQADKVLDENLIPATLTTVAPAGITARLPIFPPSHSFQLKDMHEPMLVFHEQLDVVLPITVDENAHSGKYMIKGNLRYQACDSVKCFFPRKLPFEVQVNVYKL